MTPAKVGQMVRNYLDKVHTEDELTLEQLRVLENERLDDIWLQLQRQLRNPDGTLNLKVVDRLTRLSERRSKMNGLDAAQRHEFTFGSGLAVLGIEQEHLDRAQEAFKTALREAGRDRRGGGGGWPKKRQAARSGARKTTAGAKPGSRQELPGAEGQAGEAQGRAQPRGAGRLDRPQEVRQEADGEDVRPGPQTRRRERRRGGKRRRR